MCHHLPTENLQLMRSSNDQSLVFTLTNLPIRKAVDTAADDEPLDAISNKALERADREDDGGGEAVGGQARENAEGLAYVLGDGEVVKLHLVEVHE